MGNNFSKPIEKIVNDYLNRLKSHLKGFPEQDKKELVKEIHSHIYESFMSDQTEDEIDRILHVLNKLGEPPDVISSRMSTAMVSMGKKKKLPFYILAGVLITLFGLPLGLGGISILLTLFLTICILIFTFYFTAFSLIISGWICAVISIIRIIDPYFLEPYFNTYPLLPDPTLNSIVYLIISLLVSALGFGLFFLGKYMTRGLKFLSSVTFNKIGEFRKRRKKQVRY